MIRPGSDRKLYLCREPVDMTSFVSIGSSTDPPSNTSFLPKPLASPE